MAFAILKMKFSAVRIGYINGSPWIGRLEGPVPSCNVNLLNQSGLEVEAKLIFEDAIGSNLLKDEEINDTLLRSLGKSSLTAVDHAKSILLVVWASSASESEELERNQNGSVLVVNGQLTIGESDPRAFEASFQSSELALDVDHLAFGDCIEKSNHSREFTIQNLSDSKLQYQISTYSFEGDGGGEEKEMFLSFYDNGETIKSGSVLELAGKSFTRIHANLRPARLGQRVWIISVENERNSKNIAHLFVRANIIPTEGLIPQIQTPLMAALDVFDISGRPLQGGTLSFGDECYSGIAVSRRLVLRNQATVGVDIALTSSETAVSGPVSMVDAASLRSGLHNSESDSDKEEDGQSPRVNAAPSLSHSDRSQEVYNEPSEVAVTQSSIDDDFRNNESMDEPRQRSDTTSSAAMHRSSFNSLMSPSITLTKRKDSEHGTKEAVRDRSRSRESLGSVGKPPLPTKLEPQYELPTNEVVHIPPGEEREVVVYYLPNGPSQGVSADKARKFFKHAFKLNFTYGYSTKAKQVKTLQAEAKVCVSFVSANPAVIKFGDCLLNQTKTTTVTLQNHSDLEAHLRLQIDSKVIKIEPAQLVIEPRGIAPVTITFTPQSVNPNFVKDITCINQRNKENKFTITIQSSNVDMNNFAFHAYFYKLVAFENGQEIDFTNWPTFFNRTLLEGVDVRRIAVHNLTSHDLSLSFRYGDEIQVLSPTSDYKEEFERLMLAFEQASFTKLRKRKDGATATLTDEKKKDDDVVESAERRMNALAQAIAQAKLRKVTTTRFAPEQAQTLAIAFRPSSARRPGVGGCLVYDGNMSVDIEMTKFYSEDMEALQNAHRWTFTDKDANEPPMRDEDPASYLSVAKGLRRSASANTSFASMANSSLDESDVASNQDSSTVGPKVNGEQVTTPRPFVPPIRHVPIRATVAKSCMKLSQSHFSFGAVNNSWERKNANASLFNLSAVPLLFRIEKKINQGSNIPSCVDLSDESLTGVVAPFGNESINLLFVPRIWRGKVIETIVIRNVLDGSTVDIVVKAEVCIPEHFRVECEELDFGPCFPGTTTQSARFLSLTNTTKKSREIVIQVPSTHAKGWPKGHVPVFCFHLFPPQTGEATTDVVSAQEQSEILEHQIRIATRKLDHEKVAMLTRKLSSLVQQQAKSQGDVQSAIRFPRLAPIGPLKGSVLVSIPPLCIVRVAMWLHVRLMNSSAAYHGYATHIPGLRIFESKQGDQVGKHIPFSCELFANKQQYLKATGSSPHATATLSSPHLGARRTGRSPSVPGLTLRDKSPSMDSLSAAGKDGSDGIVSQSSSGSSRNLRQVEVGTRTINEWFTFFLEINIPMSIPQQQLVGTPRRIAQVAAAGEGSSSGGEEFIFKLSRLISSADGDKKRAAMEIKLPQEEIVLTAREAKRQVKVEARYLQGGRHYASILLTRKEKATDLEQREEIVIKGQASYLILDPPLIDFGNVVVQPDETVEKDQPFTMPTPMRRSRVSIWNSHTEAVLVSAESNSNQVVVFSAETSEQIDRVLLDPNQKMDMDVLLKPSLLADAWKGLCRSLKGGVVVTCEVGSEDDRDLTHVARFQSTVPFSGVIGMSVFAVGDQRVPGSIRIINRSDKLPLRIEVTSDADDVRFSIQNSPIEIPPANELDMIVRVHTASTGLSFRNISIRNLDTGETQQLQNVACALATSEVLRIEKGSGVRVAVPVRKKDKTYVVAHDAISDEPVRVRNVSDRKLKVIMRCGYLTIGGASEDQEPPYLSGANLTPMHLPKSSPTSPGAKWRSSDLIARAETVIIPGAHRDIYFKFPRESQLALGSFKGWLTFETKGGGEDCAAAVKFQGEARVSHFDVDRTRVDAGEFGALNKWEPRTVELARLVNSEPFVPADVEVSFENAYDFIRIMPLKHRFHVEPGTLGQTVLGTIQVIDPNFNSTAPVSASGTDFEVMLKLSNALNLENEVSFPIKLRICPKRFFLEKDGTELADQLPLPTVEYSPLVSAASSSTTPSGQRDEQSQPLPLPPSTPTGIVSVNEWITVVNTSNFQELALETSCVTGPGIDANLLMVFRSTGAPIPSTLRLKPGERTHVRIVLRIEKGCALRGDAIEFGKIRFATLPTGDTETETEVSQIRVVGRVNGPPLLRYVPDTKRWECRLNAAFSGQLFNDTKWPLNVTGSSSDTAIVSFHKGSDLQQNLVDDAVDSMTWEVPPFGSVWVTIVGKSTGLAKIKFECDPTRTQGSASVDVVVGHFLPLNTGNALETATGEAQPIALTPRVSPTMLSKKTVSAQTPSIPLITGATFICEPGLYEIDAGILSEPRTWNLGGVTGDVSLVSSGMKSTDAGWITMKRTGPDTVQLKLTPQYFGDTGGFFAAYMIVPGVALIRIKMEVVMRDSDEITSAMSSSISDSLPFDLSPKEIVAGTLYCGRHRAFPFTLFNRHPHIPLVFQLTVSGAKGGLQTWFSFADTEEEHRRVTIMPSSCVRLALNLLVPENQTEDFGGLEVNIACRHLRNSRIPLRVVLPTRASQPHFAVSDAFCTVNQVVEIRAVNLNKDGNVESSSAGENVANNNGTNQDVVCVIGPDWINCGTMMPNGQAAVSTIPGLLRCKATVGQSIKVIEALAPGTLTVYSAQDPHDSLRLRVQLGPVRAMPAGGASMWRDAIELELTRACILREFSCPADIVFHEVCELLLRDPGGRGSSIAALYFRLRFGSEKAGDGVVKNAEREAQLAELRSLPESPVLTFLEM